MEKKRRNLIILVIFIIIALFLIWFLPRFWVVHNHATKVQKAQEETNSYKKVTTYGKYGSATLEIYEKDGIFSQKQDEDMIQWTDGKKIYAVQEKQKRAILFTHDQPEYYLKSYPKMEINNMWDEIRIALTATITWDMVEGKSCNFIKDNLQKYWIDKETGLILKEIQGSNTKSDEYVKQYEYDFGKTTQEQVTLPDLTGYEIIQR